MVHDWAKPVRFTKHYRIRGPGDPMDVQRCKSPTQEHFPRPAWPGQYSFRVRSQSTPGPSNRKTFAASRDRDYHLFSSISTHSYEHVIAVPYERCSEQQYAYRTLPDGPWIRILRLVQGPQSDPIQCFLSEQLIDDVTGKYNALSYVWSPNMVSPGAHSIYIDGKRFIVQENLYQCLRYLRSSVEPLYLWIDAICINQQDLDEKNHQVRQMASIYQRSHETILWLGQGDRYTDALLQWYGMDEYVDAHPSAYLRRTNGPLRGSTHIVLEKGLQSIIDNPYWLRLWIVQEVILAPSVRVVMSTASLPYDEFTTLWGRTSQALGPTSATGGPSLFRGGRLISLGINNLCRARLHETNRKFQHLIREYGSNKCHDKRDRVFGLLGLADDITIEVNYRLSKIALFQKVIRGYDVLFADEFAEHVAAALELETELTRIPASTKYENVPLKLRMDGFVIKTLCGIAWSGQPEQRMLAQPYDAETIGAGDVVYSFVSKGPPFWPSSLRTFWLILRCTNTTSGASSSHSKRLLRYKVVGAALLIHRDSILPSFDAMFGVGITRPAHDSQVYQELSELGGGDIIIEMPTVDFIAIFLASRAFKCH